GEAREVGRGKAAAGGQHLLALGRVLAEAAAVRALLARRAEADPAGADGRVLLQDNGVGTGRNLGPGQDAERVPVRQAAGEGAAGGGPAGLERQVDVLAAAERRPGKSVAVDRRVRC